MNVLCVSLSKLFDVMLIALRMWPPALLKSVSRTSMTTMPSSPLRRRRVW